MQTSLLTHLQLNILPQSQITHQGVDYALAKTNNELHLVVSRNRDRRDVANFEGKMHLAGDQILTVAPLSAHNATVLQEQLDWLKPCLLGLRTSAGMGDRLGLATPGHVRAIQKTDGKIAPIFAQQSIREMTRSGRTPRQVMDTAVWGVFQENWQGGFGADADHLKTPEDIDACLAIGFTFFTIDPGEYVNNQAETADLDTLRRMAKDLPSEMTLQATGLLNRQFQIEQVLVTYDEATLLKALVKYGRAVWHVASMYRHLAGAAGSCPFELEVSVDETEQPTTHAEHIYIASELKRLGVQWISLAPRFIGDFEKGVDYIGDVTAFENDIAGHAAIARHFGPYKLSLHSGSDKFSIYPAAMRQTRGLVHLKTAGTSYLEALRTIAAVDAGFFLEIYRFARERYETDRKSYHVSAKLERAPLPEAIQSLPGLLEQFDAREILHVTFGSVLKEQTGDGKLRFATRFFDLLGSNPDQYAQNLEKHFLRHLSPFISK